jgi:hypothetical protein
MIEMHAIVKNVSASPISLAELGDGYTLGAGQEIDFMDETLPNGCYSGIDAFKRALDENQSGTLYQNYHATPPKVTVVYKRIPRA